MKLSNIKQSVGYEIGFLRANTKHIRHGWLFREMPRPPPAGSQMVAR